MDMDGRLYDLSTPELEWLSLANKNLPACLAAMDAEFKDASRAERILVMEFKPGLSAMHYGWVSGGAITEMLDQASTACASLVTGFPCPTLTLTINMLRPAITKKFTVHARVNKVTSATATMGAELKDEEGRLVALASVVSHLIKKRNATFAVAETR